MYAVAMNHAARVAVEDAVVRMFVATDERNWATLETCFTDPFTLDMTSMVGGEPVPMTPGAVAAAWAEGFRNLDHVHHQVGNFHTAVEPGRAFVRCHGIALHYRAQAAGVKTRRFVGTYEISLIQPKQEWLIERLTFKLKFIDGNPELEKS